MTHTPGPWEIIPYCNVCDSSIEIVRDVRYTGGNGSRNCYQATWICGVNNGEDVITEEVEANARLIAAAPELLEALSGFMSLYERNDAVRLEEWWPVYTKARKALDKAKATAC